MAGFYDKNGKKIQTSSEGKKKNNAPLSHLHVDNAKTKNKLVYDGKELGTITNAGLKAIESGTLGSYTPVTEEERKTIEAYQSHIKEKAKALGKARRATYDYKNGVSMPYNPFDKKPTDTLSVLSPNTETTVKTNGGDVTIGVPKATEAQVSEFANKQADEKDIAANEIFERNGINPDNFTMNDFKEWAEEHNIKFDMSMTGGKDFSYSPKYEGGFLGIGSKRVTTDQELKDASLLFELARANANKTATNLQKENKVIGNMTSAFTGMMQGATFGFADNMADSVAKSKAEKSGLPKKYQYLPSEQMNTLAEEYPVANFVGDVGGSIATTVGVGNLVRAGTTKLFPKLANIGTKATTALVQGANATSATSKVLSGIGKWLSTSPVAQNIINDGITFAITSSAREAGAGGSVEDIFQVGLVGAVSGGVGGGVEEKLGQIGLNILFNKQLQHKILPEIARVAVSNAVGGVAYNVTSYALSPADKKPTTRDMALDFATDLAFGAIFSAKGTIEASKASKTNIDNLYNKMEGDFRILTEMNLSKNPNVGGMINLANNVIKYADTMQKLLKGEKVTTTIDGKTVDMVMTDYRFIGQNDYVKSMIGDLDTIKNRAKEFIDINSTKGEITTPKDQINAPVTTNTPTPVTPTVTSDTKPVTQTPNKVQTTSVDATPIATSDSMPVTTPTVAETQIPTAESVQPMHETAEATPATKGVTTAYTNNNEKIDLKYKVVSLDDLIVSNNADGTINPKYPQELQPRERTRQASILQVQNIAGNLVPEKLGESANVSDGSPIVGSDNVVESGNGRTMALSLVYKNNPESANKYIEFIKANAEKFGIDATNLPKNPVLVRERLTKVDRVEFVKQANESNLSAMSATELAKSDAERLSGDILNLLVPNDDGNLNTKDNQAFVGRVISEVFSQNDLNSVIGANGMLSANGLERIRNAMFYKAYGSTELASKLSESLDNDIKNITNVLVNIAPKLVAIKNGIANGNYYDLDFSQDIVDAINYLQEAKRQSLKIRDFANQVTIGEDVSSVVKYIAYVFEQKNRGAKQATLLFNHLCDIIMSKNPNQLGFLNEDVKPPKKEDVLDESIDRYNNDEESTGISIPEGIIVSRGEESAQVNDSRGEEAGVGHSTELSENDRKSDGVGEQHRPIEEETALTGDIGTPRQSEGRKEASATDDRTDEAEVGAGRDGDRELSDTVENITPSLTDKCELTATKHTATGKDIWVVTVKERLSTDDFKALREKVKEVGGYYSRFTKTLDGKAIPGFAFASEPTANELKVFNDFFADTETPTQNAQNTPKSSEIKSDKQIPTETENVATEQNISDTEVKENASTTVNNEGTKQIADFVASKLEKGKSFTSMELLKVSTVAFGGTMANNAFTVKDAYDAMELGVNKYILSMKDVSAQKMLEILELLPTQTKRTEEQVKFQQFSTPPSIAYLANYVANVNAKDTMLEPSAGIGGLAVFAKRDGATVYVNELDNRRLEVLKNMPFDRFFNENAEQINNILGGEIEPTVIVMNPPFSSSSERNIHNTKIGAKHIEQALKILAPNGRLVAIVGRGMEDGAPAFRDWWKSIKSEYNVKANIRIDGKNYSKYGTNFDIQMLVIDKNGATTHTETGSVDTLQELQQKLETIREERPNVESSRSVETNKGTEQKPSERTRQETSRTGEATDVGIKPVSDADSLADNRKPTDTTGTSRKSNAEVLQRTDADSGGVDNQAPRNTDEVDDGQRLDRRGERGGHTELRDSGRTDISDSGQHSKQPSVDRSDRNVGVGQNDVRVQRPKRTELTDSIFEQYQTQPLKFPNTKAHPGKVSESAAMSAITPPPVTYKPNLPQDIVENGVVSDVQLEAISYAGQCHSQTLANGTTRGFFLGDGTGIGKGRTIAGIMLDNYNQGKKKAVWVTENESLMLDAKRDITALFGNSDLIMQFEGGKKADKIYGKEKAILTVSYSTLSRGYDKKGSNYEKIIDWLGEDFDGVIVFDEAHNMANATGKKGKRGGDKPSQMGLAGIALQEALPKAKIIYSSATGATEVENLRYAERLGLWGEGTAFTNGDDFVSKIKAGGIASMELIARDMKAMGVYLSRNISYDDVQYDKITHNLTSQQVKIYDELARSWQIVLQNINKALEVTNQDKDGHSRGRVLGAFWNSQQRFFNQILTSMQVPSVIADIEKQLANGKSCVIQLVSTNESAQNREMERIKSNDLELDDFDLTPKQMLMAMIENSFPVEQYEEYEDENGNKKSKPVYDSNGKIVLNREAVKQRDDLLDKLGSIKVPSSPIDMIINHFGTDLVAEKTGRSRRVIQKNGKTIEENIANKKDADVDAFQNGDKRIMIFSKAGGTGKSYHADKSAKNQQQRIHYLLEAGWQADKAVQGFGRSHRSNQVSAPIFKLVTTNLKGQMRFISTIAKRLDQLGAMTKGQRQAGSQGMFSASDNLENTLASDVLAVFYKDLLANRVEGIDNGLAIIEKLGLKDKILDEYNGIKTTAEELRDVSKFLNRILSLESYEQNTVFDGYSQRLQDATEKAMADGTLDKGLENYKVDKITLNEVQDIREDERSGAKTKYYNLTAEHKIKPVKFENIPTESKSFVGFYRNKNTGVVRAVMQTSNTTDQYGNVTSNYKIVGQIKNEYIPQHRLYGNWVEVTVDEARTAWNEESAKLPEYRKESLHLISGVVLPVWDKLPTENVRIYRVLTSDGEMLIGRVIPEDMIDETLRRLGSARKREKIATSDLIAGVKNGDTVHLDNGWRIIQSKVSGENRIEIWGVDYEHADLVKKKGVFTERIQYNTRYFVPTDTNTEKIIDEILKISPVFRVENTKYSVGSEDYGNVQERNLLPNGSGERAYSASASKPTKKVDGRSSRYREKRSAKSERRKYCQALKTAGNTREEIVHGHKCEVIPTEHYTPQMERIIKKNKKDGIDNTIFVTGEVVIPFIKDSNGNPKTSRGVFIKEDGKITVIVQYDNEFVTPEQINDHEKIHDKYHTPLVQKSKSVIMNNLSVADKKHILEKLSRDYNGIIEGNEEAIIEEFVANVLSEMDYEYSLRFRELQKSFWKGDADSVDNFKVSEYTHSTDAGGVIDNIGLGDDYDLNSSNQIYLSAEEYEVVSRAIMSKNAGLSDKTLKPLDYVYSANYLYVYKNHSLGVFTAISKFDLVVDKELLPIIKEAVKNGSYSNGQTFNNWISSVRSDRGRDNSYPKRTEDAGTALYDGRLPDGTRRSNNVGYPLGDGVYPSGNYVKYSTSSAETDIEELTPESRAEIDEQFEKDRVGVVKPSQKEVWGERAQWVAHNITRVFPNIPERGEQGTFFAEFRKSMIQWTQLPKTASFMVKDKLHQMTQGLTPEEYKTFAELVYFLDLQEEAQIQKERGYTEILLPNEISPSEVDAVVKQLNEEATDNVRRALVKRQAIWDALKTQYIELNRAIGFDTDGKFKRKNYYHHQVIEYMNEGGKGTGNREIGIKAGRGWLKERQGSTKAINTDFLAVEYKAMLQMQYDVYIAETLGRIKEQYDIKPQLEKQAKANNKAFLSEIIKKEATDKDGNMLFDSKGEPDSETYRMQKWYNKRIMMGFNGLFELAGQNELPTFDGEYTRVVEAFKQGNLNVDGLYRYVGAIANIELPDNAIDSQEQSVISARTVLKYTSQKKAWVKELLAGNYQTWETLAKSMSDTHTIHQPRRGNYFYTKTVVDEDAFAKALNDMVMTLASGDVDLGSTELNKLLERYSETVRLMGAAYEQWVLPNEIVTTMKEIANPKQVGEFMKLSREITAIWKGWVTSLHPGKTIKYGTRNMLGDLDVVIAGNPKILVHSKRAISDIHQAMKNNVYSKDFMEWVERGGFSSIMYVNEMDAEMQKELFSYLTDKQGVEAFKIPQNILKKYKNGMDYAHNFRESILRYSAYLYFKEELTKNNGNAKDFVASNKHIVRGLNTIEDKAYQLSKDLLGAYDEVSKVGQTLRVLAFPFYSFTETNMKRYFRLFANTITSDDKIPKKAGKFLLKALMANMLYLLISAWNQLVMKEEDEKLPPSARNVPHVTLGQIGDKVYSFNRIGSLADIYEWVGFEDFEWTAEDLTAPLDKAWSMVTPLVKTPLELATGLNTYPSITKPRAIRDRWQYLFDTAGLGGVYNVAAGKPNRSGGNVVKAIDNTIQSALVYGYDYKESAYYEIIDIKNKYQGKEDGTIYKPTDKSNALYYMKQAIRYKDEKKALKYLDEYFENGGTAKGIKQSMAMLHPLYGYTSEETYEKGKKFLASLTEEEKEKLIIAYDYYEENLKLPENVTQYLNDKTTTEQAKRLLSAYIKVQCK